MKTTGYLAGIGGLALVAAGAGAFAVPANAATPAHSHAGTVFVQNDNTSGNAVVAYDRSADGTLQQAGTYTTGGRGGVLASSVVDHLASQGSLTYDRAHGLLYAVNAGSNTVTVFGVDGDQLHRRQVISSGGTFPVSVAMHGNLVYVLNARDGGSVQGYLRLAGRLVRIPSWHRDLGLNPAQTPEFTSTPGQVAFTPDGSKLIITTKGNGNNIDVFGVDVFGGLSPRPVVTADPGNVPFAGTFDARGHLVLSEAGPNAVATFDVRRDGRLDLISRVATGQTATCWVVRDGSTIYASNAGSGTLSAFTDSGNGALQSLGNTSTDGGTVDVAATGNGQYLYAQTGQNGIVDEFQVGPHGALTKIGSVTVPGAVGGEGIAAS